jgi:hypothetical protein
MTESALTDVPRPTDMPVASNDDTADRGDSPFESLADFWSYYREMSRKRMARLLTESRHPTIRLSRRKTLFDHRCDGFRHGVVHLLDEAVETP